MEQKDNGIIRVKKNKDNPYVMLNKYFIEDKRLSWRAKGILAYLLSKPDNWKVIVSDIVKQAKEGRDAVYSALKELKQCCYLEKYPVKNEKGRVTHWESVVYETPFEVTPREPDHLTDQAEETEKPLPENPYVGKKPLPEKPLPGFPDTENQERNNNDFNNNKRLINNNSVNQSVSPQKDKINKEGQTDRKEIEKILEQSELDYLTDRGYNPDTVEALRFVIIDMYISGTKVKGIPIPKSIVRKMLNILSIHHLEYVLERFQQSSREQEIKSPKAYLSSCLYNAIVDSPLKTESQVQYDLYGYENTGPMEPSSSYPRTKT